MDEDAFTILINTWRRNECLLDSVQHYLECDAVNQIRVIWSDPDNAVPAELVVIQSQLESDRLVFDEYRDDKLTNRFKWNEEWRTEGIFQTDDDIKFSCNLITNTFKLWKLMTDHLIGFVPRLPFDDYTDRGRGRQSRNKAFYRWSDAFSQCRYELMFQTVAGFIHRKYYKMYTENGGRWQQIKDSVNGNVTAEDITLSLLYSFHSGNAPIAVVIPENEMLIDDFKKCSGIRSEEMHSDSDRKRTNIFLDALEVMGYYDEHSDFKEIPSSTLFVDVMPSNDFNYFAK